MDRYEYHRIQNKNKHLNDLKLIKALALIVISMILFFIVVYAYSNGLI